MIENPHPNICSVIDCQTRFILKIGHIKILLEVICLCIADICAVKKRA